MFKYSLNLPSSKVHGANMGPIWVVSAPGVPHVGPINLAIGANMNFRNGVHGSLHNCGSKCTLQLLTTLRILSPYTSDLYHR